MSADTPRAGAEELLLSPDEADAARAIAARLQAELDRALLGQRELTALVVTAFLARGHVLLEGLPGLGKTELVKALARASGLEFRRLQFTPDLLPGDVTGGHMLEEQQGAKRLVFHPGPVFTNLLLADEINRASPKTQSALLEAMQERRVTVLGETRELPRPFGVLATQNPIELEGTYPLPEAQLDRFLFKLDVPRVGTDTLEAILMQRKAGAPPEGAAVTTPAELERLFAAVARVYLPEAVASYAARLVDATHPDSPHAPKEVRDYVRYGASPRGAIALAEAGRARALLAGRPGVGFEDVAAAAVPALAHRVVLDYRARLDGLRPRDLIAAVIAATDELRRPSPLEAR